MAAHACLSLAAMREEVKADIYPPPLFFESTYAFLYGLGDQKSSPFLCFDQFDLMASQ